MMKAGRGTQRLFLIKLVAALLACVLLALVVVWVARAVNRIRDGQFYAQLHSGWNLGNSLDVHDLRHAGTDPLTWETAWGNPAATPELFQAIKAAGFTSIRIPITWEEHLNADGTIQQDWLQRAGQVVRSALDSGLYVIINAHHDTWFELADGALPQAEARMASLWGQIGAHFADCDERLLFEAMNEPRLIGSRDEWTSGTPEARAMVNRLNEIFVETIRSSPHKSNQTRYLLIPTYCATTYTESLEDLAVPNDSRVGVSVHLYKPHRFAMDKDGKADWAADNPSDTAQLDRIFEDLDRLLRQNGIPVVITELGAIDKDNEAQRAEWAGYIVQKATALGIPCFWWDPGGAAHDDDTFSIFNRDTLQWLYPELRDVLVG